MLRCPGSLSMLCHLRQRGLRCLTTTTITTDSTITATERDIPIKLRKEPPTRENSQPQLGFTLPDKEPVPIPQLYDTHIPTNTLQRAILTLGAATAALLDPRRHDMVAVLGETTGYSALRHIHEAMAADEEGRRILVDKPRINSSTVDLKSLAELPQGTLGHAYINFLKDNNVTPDSRLPVKFVDDAELAYVMQRYREAHDLIHTVLGMPTNMLGEVAVKWVEAAMTGLPMCYGAAVFGPLRFRPKQRQKYVSVYLPWAVRVGRKARLLLNVYFEERWQQPIADLRREFGVEEPPKIVK